MARASLRERFRAALAGPAPTAPPAALARTDAAPPPSLRRRLLERLDSWVNHTTGLGSHSRDKRTANHFHTTPLDYQSCLDLWRGEPIAKRVIEIVPDEVMREGFSATIANDIDGQTALNQRCQEMELVDKLTDALRKQRAYGGAAILIGADDGQSPDQPLRENAIRSLKWMTVLTPRELNAFYWHNDVGRDKFGEVELYRVNTVFSAMGTADQGAAVIPAGTLIHSSRVIRFAQPVVDRTLLLQNFGWPDSILVPIERILSDYDMSWSGAAHLLEDFSQGVYKIKGLSDLVTTAEDTSAGGNTDGGNDLGTSIIAARMQLLDTFRSLVRAIVIDGEDSFERKATPLSGYPEMLQQLSLRMASVANMPVSLLLGQSPAGLNATGDADIRWWFNHIESQREHQLKPRLLRILKLMMLDRSGPTRGELPEQYGATFPSLWQLTDLEKAELRNKQAETDKIYIETGVVTPDEVANSHFKDGEYNPDITLDAEERAKAAESEGHATLEGPQALAMLAIVQAANAGQVPRDGAVAMLATAFAIDPVNAERILGTLPAPVVAPTAPVAPAANPTPPSPSSHDDPANPSPPPATDPANSQPPVPTPPANS